MYAGMSAAPENAALSEIVDLRSDTVTRPSPEMRDAMARAVVGDDVYGEDPTVNQLEETAARLLGKEAAVLFPSGSQSNLAAVLSHCGRGEECLVGDQYHVRVYEAGGASVLGGVALSPIATDADAGVSAHAVTDAVKPDDSHFPITRLLSLENTVSGHALSIDRIAGPADAARKSGLSVHLDGARFFNAVAKLDVQPSELAAPVDTISICLSKGLGAPVGSVLVGPRDVLARARRNRKLLGGAMRQAGVFAAAGLHALEHHAPKLKEDHARAARLADALNGIPGIQADYAEAQTNMLFVRHEDGDSDRLRIHLKDRGVLIGGQSPQARLVVHRDIDDRQLDLAIEAFSDYRRRN